MNGTREILVLGDSILKGIQVDPETGKYAVRNEMNIPGLERDFGLRIHNESHFGATCLKGQRLLDRLLARGRCYDAVVMDFGGNDCDHRWPEIAADPAGVHLPAVPPEQFLAQYRQLIRAVRDRGMQPILTNLPPLEPRRFFRWWCGELDQAAVQRWLGPLERIFTHQEHYSRMAQQLAREEDVPLVDLRGPFLRHGPVEDLLCADGTHPNSAGQALIAKAFWDFAESRDSGLGESA